MKCRDDSALEGCNHARPLETESDSLRARQHAERAHLDDRSAAAHAHEQFGSRGRREPRRIGGVRRYRTRRPRLELLRSHRRDAEKTDRGRNLAGAVRQAGRRIPDARGCAARTDRQLESGAALGDLGTFSRARSQGVGHVRPDDRGILDLHRQPGHRAGYLRDFRRNGPARFRRQGRGQVDTHRRTRRHGRRAAAGRDHGGLQHAGGRVPPEPHRQAPGNRLCGCAGELSG